MERLNGDRLLADSDRPHLSVVIPAYNESARIVPTLRKLEAYLEAQPYTWETLVVDDGSADQTAEVVEIWAQQRANVRVVRRSHHGKGWAVRSGMLEAQGQFRFMCDADLAMPVQWIGEFLDRMDSGTDIVIGSREAAGARRFDEPLYRHIMGRVFNWTVRLLAVSDFQDTQCGFKCFTEAAARELFCYQRSKGMGFDVEILYLALKRGLIVEELPIDWYHQPVSKVRPGVDTVDMLKDTALVRVRDLMGKYR